MSDDFDTSVAFTYIDEKGNNDDPADSGGRTGDGITQREFNAWCKLNGAPSQDIFTVPWQPTKVKIYHEQYWMPYCDKLPSGMNYLFFDTNVNSGLHEAALILQRTLGVAADGHIGVITLAAAQTVTDMPDFINRFCADHENVYEQIIAAHPQDVKFRRGWLNRIAHEKANALSMLAQGGAS